MADAKIVPTFLKHPADARGEQLIKPETSATMRELLRYVVTNGTGKKADVPGYDVGGKTGSAQKHGPHGYIAHALLTSFCAVFPDRRSALSGFCDAGRAAWHQGDLRLRAGRLHRRALGRTSDLAHRAAAGRADETGPARHKRIHNGTTIEREHRGG